MYRPSPSAAARLTQTLGPLISIYIWALIDYNHPHMGAYSGKPPRSRPRTIPPAVRRGLRHLAEDVTVWRKLQGLTQVQLADRAGIGVNTVRRLEEVDSGVTLENTLRVLRALGLLDAILAALDPHESDIGRLRSDEQLPQRVRPRNLTEVGDG